MGILRIVAQLRLQRMNLLGLLQQFLLAHLRAGRGIAEHAAEQQTVRLRPLDDVEPIATQPVLVHQTAGLGDGLGGDDPAHGNHVQGLGLLVAVLRDNLRALE